MKSIFSLWLIVLSFCILQNSVHSFQQKFVFDEQEALKLEESKEKQVENEKKEHRRSIRTQELVELVK